MRIDTKAELDVLSTISSISRVELFTPEKTVNQMLDELPSGIWNSPYCTFLDPATKSGVFLREAGRRLMEGLADHFPDRDERRRHILTKQLFGIATSHIAWLTSRRTVYGTIYADREYAISQMGSESGNIVCRDGILKRANNPASLYEGEATSRLHPFVVRDQNFTERFLRDTFGTSEFSVILGSPPQHEIVGGQYGGAKNVYHLFIHAALDLNPEYITLLTPSKWLDTARSGEAFELKSRLLSSNRLVSIGYHPSAEECFGVKGYPGSAAHFLWWRDTRRQNTVVKTYTDGRVEEYRDVLDDFGFIITDPVSKFIMTKVKQVSNADSLTSLNKMLAKPKYGTRNNRMTDDEIAVWNPYVGQYKVITNSKLSYAVGDEAHNILEGIRVGHPGEIATPHEAVFLSTTKPMSESLAAYLRTKTIRFLLSLPSDKKILSHRIEHVPVVSLTREWKDEHLYAYFGFTKQEIAYIEESISDYREVPPGEKQDEVQVEDSDIASLLDLGTTAPSVTDGEVQV